MFNHLLFLKNRTWMGIGLIVLALIIIFGVTPLFIANSQAKIHVVRVSKMVEEGEEITADAVEIVNVSKSGMSEDVVREKKKVMGQYAATRLDKGEILLASKIASDGISPYAYLNHLDGQRFAISFSIKNFAAGLSGKLQRGDIVRLFDTSEQAKEQLKLQYVEVLTTTTDKGSDAVTTDTEKEDDQQLASTVTVLATPAQAKDIVALSAKSNIHVALVYRGVAARAQQLLEKQNQDLQKLVGTEEGAKHE